MNINLKISALLLLYSSQCLAFELSGNYKANTELSSFRSQEQDDYRKLRLSSRIQLSNSLDNKLNFNAEYDIALVIQNTNQDQTESGSSFRLNHHKTVIETNDQNRKLIHNLDRLNLTYENPLMRLKLGRQAIWFGVSSLANPLDSYAPVGFNEIDTEHRYGIDGLRLTIPIGELSELDLGIVFGTSDQSEFIRSKWNLWGHDFELIASRFLQASLFGASIQSSLAGIGLYSEGAQVKPKDENPYWRHNLGANYMLSNEWILRFEYHHNGAGSTNTDNQYNIASQFPYKKGGVWFLRRHYISAGCSKTYGLWLVSSDYIVSIDDQSQILNGLLSYSFSDESTANLSLTSPTFADSESEFYDYPVTLGFSMYTYF